MNAAVMSPQVSTRSPLTVQLTSDTWSFNVPLISNSSWTPGGTPSPPTPSWPWNWPANSHYEILDSDVGQKSPSNAPSMIPTYSEPTSPVYGPTNPSNDESPDHLLSPIYGGASPLQQNPNDEQCLPYGPNPSPCYQPSPFYKPTSSDYDFGEGLRSERFLGSSYQPSSFYEPVCTDNEPKRNAVGPNNEPNPQNEPWLEYELSPLHRQPHQSLADDVADQTIASEFPMCPHVAAAGYLTPVFCDDPLSLGGYESTSPRYLHSPVYAPIASQLFFPSTPSPAYSGSPTSPATSPVYSPSSPVYSPTSADYDIWDHPYVPEKDPEE